MLGSSLLAIGLDRSPKASALIWLAGRSQSRFVGHWAQPFSFFSLDGPLLAAQRSGWHCLLLPASLGSPLDLGQAGKRSKGGGGCRRAGPTPLVQGWGPGGSALARLAAGPP